METSLCRDISEHSRPSENKELNFAVMTDIELPDTPHSDLGIDLEKGIFLRRQRGDTTDSDHSTARRY